LNGKMVKATQRLKLFNWSFRSKVCAMKQLRDCP
jgi:hypothetical protein